VIAAVCAPQCAQLVLRPSRRLADRRERLRVRLERAVRLRNLALDLDRREQVVDAVDEILERGAGHGAPR
jgi:hypothetical protein